jgi:hypothetical protein
MEDDYSVLKDVSVTNQVHIAADLCCRFGGGKLIAAWGK